MAELPRLKYHPGTLPPAPAPQSTPPLLRAVAVPVPYARTANHGSCQLLPGPSSPSSSPSRNRPALAPTESRRFLAPASSTTGSSRQPDQNRRSQTRRKGTCTRSHRPAQAQVLPFGLLAGFSLHFRSLYVHHDRLGLAQAVPQSRASVAAPLVAPPRHHRQRLKGKTRQDKDKTKTTSQRCRGVLPTTLLFPGSSVSIRI
ncbi:hypothetical protein CCMA1212_001999 [Trichoderma ghanense]|uniref:Uncharacterized protein n=1 Tax=Trichoderma ghanense TaxID=65468 RepID=A0ABY2HDH2_9HYPO